MSVATRPLCLVVAALCPSFWRDGVRRRVIGWMQGRASA
jgi:hypothetical protein